MSVNESRRECSTGKIDHTRAGIELTLKRDVFYTVTNNQNTGGIGIEAIGSVKYTRIYEQRWRRIHSAPI